MRVGWRIFYGARLFGHDGRHTTVNRGRSLVVAVAVVLLFEGGIVVVVEGIIILGA
jgi:uncharacterized membrane protein